MKLKDEQNYFLIIKLKNFLLSNFCNNKNKLLSLIKLKLKPNYSLEKKDKI